ncbi:alpha/beta hydrolase family protein [Ceratobasidium sp. AG-Ba]|nr:alpha/beta hydrolase family protein [Ceratobasidium sp. AG-Ba]
MLSTWIFLIVTSTVPVLSYNPRTPVTALSASANQGVLTSAQHRGSNISWFDCPDHDKTLCAFFDVPRNYSNLSNTDTVSIFIRRLPARVPVEERLGSILVNPGGPGGSGGNFVAFAGEWLSTLVDGKYDILGFDPRGTNLTGPWTTCFKSEAEPMRVQLQLESLGVPYRGLDFAQDRALVKDISALQATHNAACLKNGNRKMLESTGTVSVVRDIVRIVEALGEDGINYWGCSYGTVLGATLAAMRPDLIRRMVLDGVANAEAWFNDIWQWGLDGMQDTHKTLTGFLSTCAEAGPEFCAFAVPPGTSNVTQTTETLRNRLDMMFVRLVEHPVVVLDPPVGPGIFTAANLQKLLLPLLYKPHTWRGLMQILTSLEQGDATPAYTALYAPYMDIKPRPYDHNVFNALCSIISYPEIAIFCSLCGCSCDKFSLDAYTRIMGRISPTGENWAKVVGGCNGWSFRASERYTGPWTVEAGLNRTRWRPYHASVDRGQDV